MKPKDTRICFMGLCPVRKPMRKPVRKPIPTTTSETRTTSTTTTTSTISTTTTTERAALKAAHWTFGSWTGCSASCGTGTKQRIVSCKDYYGKTIDETHCSNLEKPPVMESCKLQSCGDWSPTEWSECTVTCGVGMQKRNIFCTFNQQHQEDHLCDSSAKPDTEHRCYRGICEAPEADYKVAVITSNKVVGTSHWGVGNWGMCSKTCGVGWKRRQVVCRDERGFTDDCDRSVKPDEFKSCEMGSCPSWNADPWSECSSTTCGEEGVENRVVTCQMASGEVLPDSKCDLRTKAAESRSCQGACDENLPAMWKEGPWSLCSVTCGQGIRSRNVVCMDITGKKVDEYRCTKRKPRNPKRCFRGGCPKWVTGNWSKCSVTCGEGERTRLVRCKNKRRKFVDDIYCAHRNKPKYSVPCSQEQCSLYMWKVGQWTKCSKTCGFGRKRRSVTCEDRSGTSVSSHLCDPDMKPKMKRRCSEFPCPFKWNDGPWSECSTTCGNGVQTRNVICQAVTREGWILPGEVMYGCRQDQKPKQSRYCSYGRCNSRNHWTVNAWGQCSVTCGLGKQRRDVTCVNKLGQEMERSQCQPLFKPVSLRPCHNENCYASTCKEFKKLTTIRRDGDYQLEIGNRLIKIYCRNMRRKEPEEYISLPQGPTENFSETFDKRLRRSGTCPMNGTRPDGSCKECRKADYDQSGNTTYSKIKVDLSTLTVLLTNDAYSDKRNGKFIPYGTAGDCYSSSNCPQGRFSINLVGTPFAVSVNTTWKLHGNRSSKRIWRLREGQIIRGVCGGYCGACTPDETGLKLQVLR